MECAKIRRVEEQKAREEIDIELANLKKSKADFRREVLIDSGIDAAEYFQVYDMVVKYIKPMHNWVPTVTKIEKVTNTALYEKYLKCKKCLFDPTKVQLKFHGTTADATDSIVKTGFRMPAPNKQMYGAGIYFATDSSKSAREIYTQGSDMLLLCEVALGRSLTLKKAAPSVTQKILKRLGYDSVFAPRGTDVQNDEFVVYNPDQTLPKYVIHYQTSSLSSITVNPAPTTAPYQTYKITPKRGFDPADTLQMHFRIVESQIHRLKQKYTGQALPDIKSIYYIVNEPLITKFQQKEAHFQRQYGKGTPASETVLAFHGTEPGALKSIIQNNFSLEYVSRTVHGFGIYFSEFPKVSLDYGQGLLLCQVLPGKAYVGSVSKNERIPPGYNSIAVNPDSQGRAEMIVIDDMDQILPCYIVRF